MQTIHETLNIPNDPTPWTIVQPNNNKNYCVLWLQGWKSAIVHHIDRLERLATQTGVSFAMLDYAGHGSHATPLEQTTRKQQLDEVIAAYDALTLLGYKNIIVVGASFGGYMTALLSANRHLYGIILRAPAIYQDNELSMPYAQRTALDKEYISFKKTVTSASNLAALNAIKSYRRSVYVIEQEVDSVIPRNIPQAYFNVAQRGNYLVVPATNHSPMMMEDPKSHYDYIEHLIVSIAQALLLEKQLST